MDYYLCSLSLGYKLGYKKWSNKGEKTCTVLNSFLGLSHGLSMGYYSP